MEYRGHPIIYNPFINRPIGGEPIDESLVYGVDTESFHSINLNRLHTSMVLVSSEEEDVCHEPVVGDSPFHHWINPLFALHSVNESGDNRPANTKLRGTPGQRRPGRKAKIPFILCCFYNLEYDIARMFLPTSDFFNLARINIEGSKCIVDGYELENVHMVLSGSAPHFTFILRKDGNILKVYGIDLWGYLKNGLGASAKALGIIDKLPVDKSHFHIPLEDLTEDQLDELRTYAKRDSKVTRQLYITLLDFLVKFSPHVVTKKGILPPSAPAAAARIAFGDMKNEKLPQSPKYAVQLALESYSGGLVFSRVRGPVSDILVGDRNSAYPTMMTLLPDPERVKYNVGYNMDIEELIGKVGFVRASFDIKSDFIPFITTYDGGERSNHAPGRYIEQAISIYELCAGYLVGTISHITIHEAIYLSYDEDAVGSGFLHDFIRYFHKVKNDSEKGSAMYLLAKLLMNALYGKLIETRRPESLIIPNFIKNLHVPESWCVHLTDDSTFSTRFTNILFNGGDGIEELIEDYPPYDYDPLISIDNLLVDKVIKAGTYFLPFYASLITAGQRAWMSVYTYFTKAYLADTDSAFSPLSKEEFINALEQANEITSRIGVGNCRIGDQLGDIDIELEEGTGYIAGIKQYSLDGKGKSKNAHHAIVASAFTDDEHPKELQQLFYHWAVRNLALNRPFSYPTKSTPIRIRTALLRGSDYGKFESGIRTITPKDDPRMIELYKQGELVYYKWQRK